MAASSSKPTAVHFSLVFFIIATFVLGGLYYAAESGRQAQSIAAETANKKAQDADTLLRKELDNLEKCKRWLFGATGAPPEFSDGNPQNANTVEGKVMINHFAKYGGQDTAEKSYDMILTAMDLKLKTALTDLANKTAELNREHAAYLALESKYNNMLDSEKAARAKAEKDVQDTTVAKDEAVKTLEADKKQLQDAYTELDTRYNNEQIAWGKDKATLTQRITNLTVINTKLTEELDTVRKNSFEVPTGYVRYVDSNNRLVYIDLGSADNLPLRMTFSVYAKNTSGVGRGKEDIKGSIEVVRIIGAHTSECRINEEDIHNPISGGDPIFTPLWTPGQPKRFAFAGEIDLNGDGQSDREQFHQMLKIAGAVIDAEVDDKGEVTVRNKTPDNPFGITEETKFLVLGRVPDLAESTDAEDTARITLIQQQLREMRQAAREHGVRIITLPDFLAWMGFRNEQRLFKPGTEQPYTLEAGSRSSSVSGVKRSTSSGATSQGTDPRKKNLGPSTSSGTTSKLFKGR